ncbi:hypothetical protein M0802_008112 [Mischocyttarus mexicanus]|nr:hypothetical protein M0802_008112 [Mischocyttarus mexicanus]
MEDEDESMSRSRMERQSACTPSQQESKEQNEETRWGKKEQKELREEEEKDVEDASRPVRRETAKKNRDS